MSKVILKEEHAIFRKAFRQFLQQHAAPYFEKWEQEKQVPRSFWLEAGKQGFLCPWAEEKYGGAEADFGYSIIISEEMAVIGAGIGGIGLHNDVVMPYIQEFGTEEQKQRWLPKAVTGETITAIAMTEPGTGSDLAGIKTTAVKHGDEYIINGEKTFITNGIHADVVIVACKTDVNVQPAHKGISLIIVEKDTPGFSRGRKLRKVGMHAQDTAELIFEDVKVPAENLLGNEGEGFKYLMENLQQERLLAAIGGQVAVEDMLELTLSYVKEREAFGKPIAKFQNTQFILAEIATEVQLGRTFLNQLIHRHINGDQIETEVSMAKWWITDMARRNAPKCMQLHGGYGYMEEYKIARRYRDIAVSPIFAGTNEIMKQIIAKNIGL